MSWKHTSLFYHQLRSILHTGLTLVEALPLAAGRGLGFYSEHTAQWIDACGRGQDWASQLRASGEAPFASALVEAGEKSGRLDEMCEEISGFYDHLIETRSMIISRAIYPVVLLHATLMIPTLPGIFKGDPLWMLFLGPGILWALVIAAFIAAKAMAHTGILARIALWPFVAKVTNQLAIANTCLVTKAGLAAGMLMHEALDLAAPAAGNRIWSERIRTQAKAVFEGTCPDCTTALQRAGFPSDIEHILRGAEASGELETGLGQAAAIGRERFRGRVTWSFRVFMGILYGLAMLYAALTIISMFMSAYGNALNDAASF